MRRLSSIAAGVLCVMMLAAEIDTAAAQQKCTGPFAQCARAVSAICTTDFDGAQRMTYKDTKSMVFQRCVGRVYEARGLPNPYKRGNPAGTSELPFPRTTLEYPQPHF